MDMGGPRDPPKRRRTGEPSDDGDESVNCTVELHEAQVRLMVGTEKLVHIMFAYRDKIMSLSKELADARKLLESRASQSAELERAMRKRLESQSAELADAQKLVEWKTAQLADARNLLKMQAAQLVDARERLASRGSVLAVAPEAGCGRMNDEAQTSAVHGAQCRLATLAQVCDELSTPPAGGGALVVDVCAQSSARPPVDEDVDGAPHARRGADRRGRTRGYTPIRQEPTRHPRWHEMYAGAPGHASDGRAAAAEEAEERPCSLALAAMAGVRGESVAPRDAGAVMDARVRAVEWDVACFRLSDSNPERVEGICRPMARPAATSAIVASPGLPHWGAPRLPAGDIDDDGAVPTRANRHNTT